VSRYSSLFAALAASSLTFLAPTTTEAAAPRLQPLARTQRAQYDAQGREVLSPEGEQFLLDDGQTAPFVPLTQPSPVSQAAAPSQAELAREPLDASSSGEFRASREWYRAIFGVGIGATGLTVADIDADGTPEVVAAAAP
jgi:hypothetical protein